MATDTTLTIIGNATSDPELRFTASGTAVANFTIVSTPRYYDRQAGEWKDGDALFLRCNIWRRYAENVAESVSRGMRLIVQGRLRQRNFETKEGEKRSVLEMEVDEVGPSLRFATAQVNKVTRNDSATYGAPAGQDDPWSGANAGSASVPDEPPF
jgi:single-strand DNA-binding protein